MPTPIRELLHVTSPFHVHVMGEGEGTPLDRVVIKGFASVETDDRSGDRTDPREFNIDEFMAAPTLLINHKFWVDAMGNSVAVGRPLTMNAARLTKLDGNDDEWAVIDLKTRQQINTFPKSKVPSLTRGAKGLFITAEVTQEEVQAQIARGELSGMSWRGLVVVEFELDPKTNRTVRVLRDIDLFEISVVHIPDHNQSTFVVGKMVDGRFEEVGGVSSEDVQLWQVRLEKSKFASLGMVVEYLKAHRLEYDSIREDDMSFFATQQPADRFQLEKTVRIKMGDAYMLMAPPKEKPEPTYESCRLVAEMVDVAKSIEKEPVMADDVKAVQADAQATDTGETKEEAAKKAKQADMDEKKKAAEAVKAAKAKAAKAADNAAEDTDKAAKQKSVAEGQLDALGAHVATDVAAALKPCLEGIAGGMTAMGNGLKSLTETVAKMAPGAQAGGNSTDTKLNTDTNTDTEKKEVVKAASGVEATLQDVLDQVNSVAKRMSDQQEQIVEIAKSAVALGESIPNGGVEREERVDVAKAVDGDNVDPNSCFDSSFPWMTELA